MAEKRTVLVIARETKEADDLAAGLAVLDYTPEMVFRADLAVGAAERASPQVILIEGALFSGKERLRRALGELRAVGPAPVIGVLSPEQVAAYDPALGLDDFVLCPCSAEEVAARIRQVRWRKEGLDGGETLKVGDLVLDLARFSVTLAGRPVSLTFTEYQLLKFLASHKGMAFTRESLLNQVWGYDYYGGDRTVDVHVTRLRDKIEDSTHTFIETVRGVGYRFKDVSGPSG